MELPLVMTVIGRDRPGLVELLAAIVAEHGGNWLESRMSRLGGQFAGILRVHIPAAREAALLEALKQLEAQGLVVVAHADTAAAPADLKLALLEIVGQDRPGIVRQISRVLALHQVNVEELDSACASAPMSGETLFKATARLHIPAGCDTAQLRQNLEQIAHDLLVDIKLQDLARG